MKADLSRDSYRAEDGYTRVIHQQGRVQLDADFNAQACIQRELARQLAADLIGPHGGPVPAGGTDTGAAFAVEVSENKVIVKNAGVYYVEGLRLEAHQGEERVVPLAGDAKDRQLLVYLQAYEREVTWLEAPAIREVALGGPDTSVRARLEWNVGLLDVTDDKDGDGEDDGLAHLAKLAAKAPKLQARARVERRNDDPCDLSPDAQYRGLENQLYRIEVHTGNEPGSTPTFKWSRDNGSLLFGIEQGEGTTLVLSDFGRDERSTLSKGTIVELVALGQPQPQTASTDTLYRVVDLKPGRRTVTLDRSIPSEIEEHPMRREFAFALRRWDHQARPDKPLPLPMTPGWLDIEDGVQISFSAAKSSGKDEEIEPPTYRPGDYWLIPARTATGNIEWPIDTAGLPAALPPHGPRRHRAPLAMLENKAPKDLRRWFAQLAAKK